MLRVLTGDLQPPKEKPEKSNIKIETANAKDIDADLYDYAEL